MHAAAQNRMRGGIDARHIAHGRANQPAPAGADFLTQRQVKTYQPAWVDVAALRVQRGWQERRSQAAALFWSCKLTQLQEKQYYIDITSTTST
jgi:hypothetical protein